MIGGDFPWRLTPADVWQLRKDGFSVSEIACIASVNEDVAAAMVFEATPHGPSDVKEVPRESPAFPQEQAA